MKVLNVSSLIEGIKGLTNQLSQLEMQLNGVEKGIRSFVNSKDAFRAKGANAIRRFYEYAHLSFLQFFQTFLSNFQSKLKQLQVELAGLEGDAHGFIDEEAFLTSELENEKHRRSTGTDLCFLYFFSNPLIYQCLIALNLYVPKN